MMAPVSGAPQGIGPGHLQAGGRPLLLRAGHMAPYTGSEGATPSSQELGQYARAPSMHSMPSMHSSEAGSSRSSSLEPLASASHPYHTHINSLYAAARQPQPRSAGSAVRVVAPMQPLWLSSKHAWAGLT